MSRQTVIKEQIAKATKLKSRAYDELVAGEPHADLRFANCCDELRNREDELAAL